MKRPVLLLALAAAILSVLAWLVFESSIPVEEISSSALTTSETLQEVAPAPETSSAESGTRVRVGRPSLRPAHDSLLPRPGNGLELGVRMRVLGPDGPCAGLKLTVSPYSWTSSGWSRPDPNSFAVRTDHIGFVLIPLRLVDASDPMLLALEEADASALQAIVVVPGFPAGRWLELGDVQLEALGPLVTGTVVDDAGQPIAAAKVDVVGQIRPELIPNPDSNRTDQSWEARSRRGMSWSALSNAKGRFELRAPAFCSDLELRATAHGWPSAKPQICRSGSRDVLIVMRRGGGLEGRVLLSPMMRREDVKLTIQYEPLTGEEQTGEQLGAALSADGAWSAQGLRPGKWRIGISDSRVFTWEPLAPILEAFVVAGETTRVPDIDLTHGVHILNIEVVDAMGLPVPSATGTFHGPGSYENNDIVVQKGRATLMTRYPSVDAWFGGPGYMCEHVPNLRDGVRVVLHAAPQVELALQNLAALPPEPYQLCVQLDSGRGADNWILGEISNSPVVGFDRRGRATVEMRSMGNVRILLYVRREGSEGNAQMEFLSSAIGGPIEIRSPTQTAPIPVNLDAESVKSALLRLTKAR
ncbi:MAG: carboxypeptidase regulatory-like domain-containing protein [Planctomycetes bacterium]|nr:carboxypeptidase regulatory-like domain-containing protein [Planctomycetota bacterium]